MNWTKASPSPFDEVTWQTRATEVQEFCTALTDCESKRMKAKPVSHNSSIKSNAWLPAMLDTDAVMQYTIRNESGCDGVDAPNTALTPTAEQASGKSCSQYTTWNFDQQPMTGLPAMVSRFCVLRRVSERRGFYRRSVIAEASASKGGTPGINCSTATKTAPRPCAGAP